MHINVFKIPHNLKLSEKHIFTQELSIILVDTQEMIGFSTGLKKGFIIMLGCSVSKL